MNMGTSPFSISTSQKRNGGKKGIAGDLGIMNFSDPQIPPVPPFSKWGNYSKNIRGLPQGFFLEITSLPFSFILPNFREFWNDWRIKDPSH